jgi:hypothetical protein
MRGLGEVNTTAHRSQPGALCLSQTFRYGRRNSKAPRTSAWGILAKESKITRGNP